MTEVTKDALWAKISEDKEFRQYPEALKKAMRPYTEALPTILADLLDKPATMSNIAQARVRYLRYCADNGYVKDMLVTVPDKVLKSLGRKYLLKTLREELGKLINNMEKADDLLRDEKKKGFDENRFMLDPESGLSAETRKLYEDGWLTIGKLLLVEPMIIAGLKPQYD